MIYKNNEGYADPTAGIAMSRMMKEYRQRQRKRYANKNRKKVYVASKYAGDVRINVRDTIRYCRFVIAEGHMPVASHILYAASGMLRDEDASDRELGCLFGLALLAVCDEVWVFGEISPGMKAEIEEAKRLRKPIVYKGEL